MSNKSSTNAKKPPYLKAPYPFWRDHPDRYTPKALEYYEESLARF